MKTPEDIFETAFKRGKISGSWLITGPAGVGKKTLAKQVAELILGHSFASKKELFHPRLKWVERGLTDEAKKEIQKTILAGKAVLLNDSASRKKDISVDDIREALQFLSLKAEKGQYKVLVISPADDMNHSAANALLKMLEEPGKDSVILLLSESSGKLLPTIKSRCRHVVVRKKSIQEVEHILQKLRPECPHVELVAELSDGSVGLGLSIIDHSGLDIFQKICAFDVCFYDLDHEKIDVFSEMLSRNETAFSLFQTLLLNDVAQKAKKAVLNNINAEYLLDLYDELKQMFRDTVALNLDRRLMVKNALIKRSFVREDQT